MKYISLIVAALFIFAACGKKTDPIPKDTLENVAAPKAVIVKPQPEGMFIANNENALLIVEKAVPQENGECSQYQRIKILEPKADFIDTDVTVGQKYLYRLTKRTLTYKLTSEPSLFSVVYHVPPHVTEATFIKTDAGYDVNVVPSGDFMRMDIYSAGKSIVQTGHRNAQVPAADIKSNTLGIRLTDDYGNIGDLYTLTLVKKPAPEIMPPNPVTNLAGAYIGGALRIVWDGCEKGNCTYSVKVCDNVSCETNLTSLPYYIYKKEFDKCLNITVNALTTEGRSIDSTLKFCR